MENNGFKHYSDVWKKADQIGHSQKTYTEKEIKKIKMKKSLDFSKYIHKTIVFDYVLKSILIFGMLLLAWFYKTNIPMLITIFILIGISFLSIFKEFTIQKQLQEVDDFTRDLKEVISKKLNFYESKLFSLKVMLAFSNALFVWVGSSFYYYSKYGYYKIEDIRDFLVAVLLVSIAFGISFLTFSLQFRDNASELKESINVLDEQVAGRIHDQLKKKRRHKVIMAIIAAIGLILFIVLVTTYLIKL